MTLPDDKNQPPPTITGIRMRVSHEDTYEKSFDNAYSTLKTNENYENKIPFIFLGVAYLEYCLNLAIIDFFNKEVPEYHAERFARYYLRSLPLKTKVDLLPSILSHYQLMVDPESDTIQALSILISVRNKVTHHADFYETIDNVQHEGEAALFTVSTADNDINKISRANIDRVYNSVKGYVKDVCNQYATKRALTQGGIIKAMR